MKGRLIVIEGLDGSGKATQSNLLCEFLKKECVNFFKVSFPDYDSPSSELVKMYLNSEFGEDPNTVNAYASTSFFAVDRYASYIKKWKCLYDDGAVIIADRYTTSNATYQMTKLNKCQWNYYLDWMQDYEYNKLELPKPDAVIYLNMPIEVSQKFMSIRYNGDESKKDLHESNKNFLFNCRDAALYASDKLGWHVIDCCYDGKPRTMHDINCDIINKLKSLNLGF